MIKKEEIDIIGLLENMEEQRILLIEDKKNNSNWQTYIYFQPSKAQHQKKNYL